MAGQHHDVVGQRQHLGRRGCAASSGGRRPAGRCGRSSRRTAGRRRTSPRRRPRSPSYGVRNVTEPCGVAGRVVDHEPQARRARAPGRRTAPARRRARPTRSCRRAASGSSRGDMPAIGSAQQVPVARVDPGGGVVRAGDRGDAPHVVDVAVGDEHGDGLEPVLAHDLGDPVGGVLAGVDDDALATRGRWPRRSSSCPTDPRGNRRSAPAHTIRPARGRRRTGAGTAPGMPGGPRVVTSMVPRPRRVA